MVSLRSALSSASILVALFARDVLADNPINSAFPYGSTKVRGVNLGGWLVLEVSTHHVLSSRCHRHPAPRTAVPASPGICFERLLFPSHCRIGLSLYRVCISLGSLQVSSTTLAPPPLSTSGHSASTRTRGPHSQRSSNTGIRGSLSRTSLTSPLLGESRGRDSIRSLYLTAYIPLQVSTTSVSRSDTGPSRSAPESPSSLANCRTCSRP